MNKRTATVKTHVARNANELAALLDLPPAAAAEWEFQSSLVNKIIDIVERSALTHAEVARLAGTSRTRVTAILNRNTGDISTDLLLRVLWALGYQTKLTFKRIPAA